MAKRITIFLTLLLSLATTQLWAQESPEMADILRENGKIYVVVAVLAIIFAGIIVYLIVIDRKAKKLDKELNELKK